jgi:hypothetical protein
MSFLTIFTAPKPFTNPHIAVIQRNAIQSWLHLGTEVDVILVGEEEGLAQAAQEFGVPLLKEVRRNTRHAVGFDLRPGADQRQPLPGIRQCRYPADAGCAWRPAGSPQQREV